MVHVPTIPDKHITFASEINLNMPKKKTTFVNPIEPLHKAISRFHEATLMQVQANLVTQTVFPTEVYPGYRIINESRKAHGSWYSTGEGARSFTGRVVKAGEIGDVVLQYQFNDYLKYAELGVGKDRPVEKVDRSKKANYRRRYVNKWVPRSGRTHRPAIMMELRHLGTRLERYATDFYGYEAQFKIMDLFDGMILDFSI